MSRYRLRGGVFLFIFSDKLNSVCKEISKKNKKYLNLEFFFVLYHNNRKYININNCYVNNYYNVYNIITINNCYVNNYCSVYCKITFEMSAS